MNPARQSFLRKEIIMFWKRKKKYPEVVAEARQAAESHNIKTTVFQRGKIYNWCDERFYSTILAISDEPVIQLLICMPDGGVAQ